MSAKTDVIISVKHLAAAYGDRQILNDINFEVRRGEIFVIIAVLAAARVRSSST